MSDAIQTDLIQIGGAGPAGLAAAITLARAGRRVLVHELHGEVGHRFNRDFQGLENWSAQHDTLDLLREAGIGTAFTAKACRRAETFDAWGKRHEIEGTRPFLSGGTRAGSRGALQQPARSSGGGQDCCSRPQSYAYLLVMNCRGTVKSCMFSGFKQEHVYVQRTVAAF